MGPRESENELFVTGIKIQAQGRLVVKSRGDREGDTGYVLLHPI